MKRTGRASDAGIRRTLAERGLDAPVLVFVSLSLVFGTSLVGLTPLFQAPDEIEHFRRAYQVSEGVFLSERRSGPEGDPERFVDVTGGEIPLALMAVDRFFEPLRLRPERSISLFTWEQSFRLRVDDGRRVFVSFTNSTRASPLPYLPQALGILVARGVTDVAVVQAYAGRIANLLVATLLIALAVAATPLCKWGFVALALTPMMLSQSASLSADGPTNAVCFLLLARVFHAVWGGPRPIGRRDSILLVALAACVGLVKQMYLPLPLAAWMIPRERFLRRRGRELFVSLLVLAAVVPSAAWSLTARAIYSPDGPGIDANAQLVATVSDPLEFARAILRTLASRGPALAEEYLGVLGTLDTRMPPALLIGYALLLLGIAVVDLGNAARASWVQRFVALAVAGLGFLTVCVSIHMLADRVGEDVIWLQGRYLLPLGPLLLVTLHGVVRPTSSGAERARGLLTPVVALSLTLAMATTSWAVADRFLRLDRRPEPFELVAADTAFREVGLVDPLVDTFAASLADPQPAAVAAFRRAVLAETNGRVDEALGEYRVVLRLRPESFLVARQVAMISMTREDRTRVEAIEAERLARLASRASRFEDARELGLLASTLAATDRYSEAIRVQEAAVRKARETDEALARELERQLERYRSLAGRPASQP